MKHYIIAALAAVLCFWQCTVEEDQPIVYDAPVAEFPAEIPSEISLNVGESYTFSVNFSEGEKLTKEWRVNDHLESSSDRLTYTFNEPGTFTVSFKAYNGTGSVSRSYTVVVGDKLVMHLSVGDSTVVSRLEESYLQLYAIVEHGEEVEHSWSVDGEKMSDKAYFNTFFLGKNPAVGSQSYTVEYKGTNPTGAVYTKAFTVKVKDRPLTVKFSDDSKSIFGRIYPVPELSVEVLFGASGVVHKWYVDDELVCEGDTFKHMFKKGGDYTVKYLGTNAASDTAERSWTFSISPEALLADFEDGTAVSGNLYGDIFQLYDPTSNTLSKEKLSVVDNPVPGSEGKALRYYINTNTGANGGFIVLAEGLKARGLDLSEFDGISFKACFRNTKTAKTSNYVCIVYSDDMTAKTADKQHNNAEEALKADPFEWKTLEYDVDFSQEGTLQIYAINTSKKGKTASRYSEVFFDDITLYQKSDSSVE